ncbi:hypothetical protein HDU99_002630 [Rhizoclosmatium hyalinum]|nr:hypothetical protein HDU99_002630 [Rhizoclosmatium hyalinum]
MVFCRQDNVEKSNPALLVTSVVYQLCKTVGPVFENHVMTEMEADAERVLSKGDQSILKNPEKAFTALVTAGLQKVSASDWKDRTLLIVIDGLDELKDDVGYIQRGSIWKILARASSRKVRHDCLELPNWVKVFGTCRPERDISFTLHDVMFSAKNIDADLETFVKVRSQLLWKMGTPETQQFCEELVEKSDGVFIYARTVYAKVKEEEWGPQKALNYISSLDPGIDGVYKNFYDRSLLCKDEKLDLFQKVFAVLFTVQMPLTLQGLATVGDLKEGDMGNFVSEVIIPNFGFWSFI